MGEIRSQSIKSLVILYLGIAIGFVNVIILFPLTLTTEEIGLVNVIRGGIVGIFSILALFGSNTMVIRFFPFFKDEKNQHGGLLFFAIMVATLGFLLSLLLFFAFKGQIINWFIEKSPLLIDYLEYAIPIALGIVIFRVVEAFSRSYKRIVIPNFLFEVYVRIMMSIAVLGYFFGFYGLKGMMWVLIFCYLSVGLLNVAYLASLGQLFLKPNWSIFKHNKMKEMLNFAGFVVLGNSTTIIQGQVDQLMLASLDSLGNTGIYSVAFYITSVIEMPRRPLGQITIPVISNAWKENDLATINDLYKKTATLQLLAALLVFILIWINIDSLFDLMPNGDSFRPGKYVILFVGLAKLFDMFMGINNEIIVTSQYYRWNVPLILFLIIVSILTNLWLIPIYGLIGAAIATAITVFCYNALRFLFIYWKFRMHPFNSKTFVGIFIGAITLGIGYLLPTFDLPIIDIAYRSILMIAIYGLLTIALNVSPDVNNFAKNLKDRFLN